MLRLGIVGSGGMGSSHAHGTNLAAPRCSLAWVADVDGDRARQLAGEVGCRALTDWTAGLDDVDAVTICTPHHLHAPQTLAALRAGKHVMIEKPMAMNEAECREMIRVADEVDRRLMVAYTMRYRPAPARLKELLVEGSYGPPFKISAWTQGFLDHSDRIGHWAARRDQLGGGVLFSHGCHYIDLIQWYLDALPINVAMVGTRRGTDWLEGEGTAHAVLEFPDGVLASYDCSWGMRHTVLNGIHIHCPEALLVSNYTTIEVVRGREREEIFPPPGPGETPPGWATLGEINHFLDCIERGETPLTDGREGLKSLQTIWRLYEQSGWDGC